MLVNFKSLKDNLQWHPNQGYKHLNVLFSLRTLISLCISTRAQGLLPMHVTFAPTPLKRVPKYCSA